jgi:gliotoxin/aspirochlorine/mycotoxins biosynthesis cytochrome P450 monooxygenase
MKALDGRQVSGPAWQWPNGHLADKFLFGRERSEQWQGFGSVYRIWAGTTPEMYFTTTEV